MLSESRRLISKGIVDKLIEDKHAVRVIFPDKDNLTSAELPVLTSFAAGNSSYALPQIGDVVACIFESEDDDSGAGYVIGAFYDDKNPPKAKSVDITRIDFKDGSFIEFDRSKGNLTVNCTGDIKINGRRIYLNE